MAFDVEAFERIVDSADINWERLAKYAHVAPTTLLKWRKGYPPGTRSLLKVLDVLNERLGLKGDSKKSVGDLFR
jgi:hypothetical protein